MLRSRQVAKRRVHPMLGWRHCSHCLTFSLLLMVALVSPILEAGESDPRPQVSQFTPLGTIKPMRQDSAMFSETMVPFSDPRIPDRSLHHRLP
jgi:hypothetical protein